MLVELIKSKSCLSLNWVIRSIASLVLMYLLPLPSLLSSLPFNSQGLRLTVVLKDLQSPEKPHPGQDLTWPQWSSRAAAAFGVFFMELGGGGGYSPSLKFEGKEININTSFQTESTSVLGTFLWDFVSYQQTQPKLKCQAYFLEMLRISEGRKSCHGPCVLINFAIFFS